jgi:hypothetical protein
MNSPLTPFRIGSVTRIETVLTANGITGDRVFVDPEDGQALPYVEIKFATLTRRESKDNNFTEATMTFNAWADSRTGAELVADYVLEAMTDDSNLVSVTGFSVSENRLDFIGPASVEENEGGNDNLYAVPVRVRYRFIAD